jgi:hypothetical protein
LVSVVEENLHATSQLDSRHAIVGKGRTASKRSCPIYYSDSNPFNTRNVLLRIVVTRKNPIAFDSSSAPNSQGPDSPEKNERLVRIMNTQHMPRRVDLQYSPSPVLRTDASARSRLSRSRRSRRTSSLRSSSASCFAGPQPTRASRAGSGGGGEVHTPAGRRLAVVRLSTGSVEARLR